MKFISVANAFVAVTVTTTTLIVPSVESLAPPSTTTSRTGGSRMRQRSSSNTLHVSSTDFGNEDPSIVKLWDDLVKPQQMSSTGIEDEDIGKSWLIFSKLGQEGKFADYKALMMQLRGGRNLVETANEVPAMDLKDIFDKAKMTYREVRELQASGKYAEDDLLQDIHNIPNVVEKVALRTAATLGKSVGTVFGGHEPYNYIE